ncbi:hypothetical protein CEXT_62251 [Caerostris extrusa]|uniref:Uncharacterized protein n=1 Tax=Caerostris extrusa TaxID=172846 RepID=A0AAV4R6Y5_CAEEX|nr:hypothetical protein CEXT_62251 [Caerostris extrusa]
MIKDPLRTSLPGTSDGLGDWSKEFRLEDNHPQFVKVPPVKDLEATQSQQRLGPSRFIKTLLRFVNSGMVVQKPQFLENSCFRLAQTAVLGMRCDKWQTFFFLQVA